MNEDHIKRAMATCIHFNGVMNPTCKAGLAYPKGQALPCIAPFSPNLVQPSCPNYQATSREEVAKEEAEFAEVSKNINIARAAIVHLTKGKRRVQGELPCPICKPAGKLSFSVAYNGHVHACCTTKDCVRWME